MSFNTSVALVVPEAQRDNANLVACALGFDVLPGSTFARGLSASGAVPATHFGAHTWAEQSLLDMLAAFKNHGTLPAANWGAVGLTDEEASVAIAAMLINVGTDPAVTWPDLLAANNLIPIPPPPRPGGVL